MSGSWLDREIFAIGMIAVGAAALRVAFLGIVSPDASFFLLPWFEQISHGGMAAVAGGLADVDGNKVASYSPPYYYLLWLASHLPAGINPLWIIKFISFAFDLLGAFFAYRIAGHFLSARKALWAAALVFAAPTAILNSGWFGQCDMIWVSLVLGCVYFMLAGKSLVAMAIFGIAFAFKAQAIFISPFLFMLFLRGEIRFWHVFAAPAAYLAMMVPAVLSGVSWSDAVLVYLHQGDAYDRLSMHAPNLYYFFGESFYFPGVAIGMALTFVACLALSLLPVWRKSPLDIKALLLGVTMFLAIVPFLLPKMHDRYFFAADMASIILAMFIPRLWPVPVLFQISSLGSYQAMMSWSLVDRVLTQLLPMAAMVNTVLAAYLVFEFVRVCRGGSAPIGQNVKLLVFASAAVILANAVWQIASIADLVLVHLLCSPALASWMCQGSLPGDWAINGIWPHWAAFATLQLLAIPIAKAAVYALWEKDWPARLGRVQGWFAAPLRQSA